MLKIFKFKKKRKNLFYHINRINLFLKNPVTNLRSYSLGIENEVGYPYLYNLAVILFTTVILYNTLLSGNNLKLIINTIVNLWDILTFLIIILIISIIGLKNKVKFKNEFILEEDLLIRKHYIVMLYGGFGFFLLNFRGFFTNETITDLIFITSIYTFLAAVITFLISKSISEIYKYKNINLNFGADFSLIVICAILLFSINDKIGSSLFSPVIFIILFLTLIIIF